MSWLAIIITFALVDNVILSRLLGICPSVCAPGSIRSALRTGLPIGILMALSALAGWAIDTLVLVPLGLTFLRTPAFLFAVAGLALLMDRIAWGIAAHHPGLDPLVPVPEAAVNCATLGAVLIITRGGYSALESLVAGIATGLGYFIVNAMMGAIKERLEIEQVPRPFRGLPLQLISAGLIAYAFMAFDKAFLARVLGG